MNKPKVRWVFGLLSSAGLAIVASCNEPVSTCPEPNRMVFGICAMLCRDNDVNYCLQDSAVIVDPDTGIDSGVSNSGLDARADVVSADSADSSPQLTDASDGMDGSIALDAMDASDARPRCDPANEALCNEQCVVLSSSIEHCGRCSNACAAPANGAAICRDAVCGLGACQAGFADCDMSSANGCEVNINEDPANCGRCGGACPAGMNGTATCAMGACGLRCNAGFHALNGMCIADGVAPRMIAPMSLGDVTRRQPALRWELPPVFDGAVVELCRDRACAQVIETIRARGTSARPTNPLPASSVVFWRLRGTSGMATDSVNSATWLFHVPVRDASAGVDSSFNPHFDVNGDGFDDVAVGARLASPGGRRSAGEVRVYHGNPMGVGIIAARVLEGSAAFDSLGYRVANAGDVNGDGFADLLVAAPDAAPGARVRAGITAVYHGAVAGLIGVAARVLEGRQAGEHFGDAMAGAGDLNGDGYSDIVVGSEVGEEIAIFNGGALGTANSVTIRIPGGAGYQSFGRSISMAGDLNGDGFSDLVVGASSSSPGGRAGAGAALIFHGAAMGVTIANRVVEGSNAFDAFGEAVASAGDVNGDGFADVVIGSPAASPAGRSGAGLVAIFHGSALGVPPLPNRTIDGVNALDGFGFAVLGVGDANGDGFADIAVGVPFSSPGGRAGAGGASIFLGGGGGVAVGPLRVFAGNSARDSLGRALGYTGDFNADGFADFSIGAPLADPAARVDAGTVNFYLGSIIGPANNASFSIDGVASGDSFGWAISR